MYPLRILVLGVLDRLRHGDVPVHRSHEPQKVAGLGDFTNRET